MRQRVGEVSEIVLERHTRAPAAAMRRQTMMSTSLLYGNN